MRVNDNTNIETLREMMGPDLEPEHAEVMLELLQRNGVKDTDDVSFEDWEAFVLISYRTVWEARRRERKAGLR